MAEGNEKGLQDFWSVILKGEKILSDREAADMNKMVRRLRKEKGFRNVPHF